MYMVNMDIFYQFLCIYISNIQLKEHSFPRESGDKQEAKKRQMAAAVVIALRSLRLQKKLCLNRKHTKRFFEEKKIK